MITDDPKLLAQSMGFRCSGDMAAQRDKILEAETKLGVGPVALSRLMNTKYDTYKDWKSERSVMPGVAYKCIELLIGTSSKDNSV